MGYGPSLHFECQPLLILAQMRFSGEFGGSQKDGDRRDFNTVVPAVEAIASLLWLRQASWRRAQDYSLYRFCSLNGLSPYLCRIIQPQSSGWKNLLKIIQRSIIWRTENKYWIVESKSWLMRHEKSNIPRKSSFLCLCLISRMYPKSFQIGFLRDGILTRYFCCSRV